jgi:hypothetical protein
MSSWLALFFVQACLISARRTDLHRRLGTACMMPSAFSRIPLNLTFIVSGNVSILLLFDLCVMVPAVIDTLRNRRLHPAFGWGGSIALAALNLAYPIAISPQWLRFGTSLVA